MLRYAGSASAGRRRTRRTPASSRPVGSRPRRCACTSSRRVAGCGPDRPGSIRRRICANRCPVMPAGRHRQQVAVVDDAERARRWRATRAFRSTRRHRRERPPRPRRRAPSNSSVPPTSERRSSALEAPSTPSPCRARRRPVAVGLGDERRVCARVHGERVDRDLVGRRRVVDDRAVGVVGARSQRVSPATTTVVPSAGVCRDLGRRTLRGATRRSTRAMPAASRVRSARRRSSVGGRAGFEGAEAGAAASAAWIRR